MFNHFPKTRSILPEAYQSIYNTHYKDNREGNTTATSVAQKMETWLHKKVASDTKEEFVGSTLEIGAGTLNQLQFEQANKYDIVEPFKELFQNSPDLNKVNNVFADISEIDLSNKYDRITSVATFEHILNLPQVVAQSCLLMKEDGVMRTAIPSEGGFLWKMAYTLTTGVEFRLKHGLNYETLMRHEHVNTAKEIKEILNYFFESSSVSYYGMGPHLSFYQYIENRKPNIQLAEKFLAKNPIVHQSQSPGSPKQPIDTAIPQGRESVYVRRGNTRRTH